ncbi:hypothetical protein FRC06_003218 [Ceratobasidium sp. 370]|nr:hypothetical protein FRC06_003218 [Ceratobasidium sp. 370]
MSDQSQLAAAVPGHDDKSSLAGRQQPVSALARQQNVAAAQRIASLELQLKYADDRISLLEQTVQDLQGRDEGYKVAIGELTLRMKASEAHGKHLETTLNLFLQQSGIDMSKLGDPANFSGALTGQDRELTAEEEAKVTVSNTRPKRGQKRSLPNFKIIIKHTLSTLYGVPKFSMKEHGEYPAVGKDHTSWPSRRDGPRLIPLHRFDFRENYSSPRNNDTFLTWIDHSLNHGPHIAHIPNLPDTVFNRTSVTNTCKKHYTYLKRRYKESFGNHTAPLISIKRKVEDLDAPEPGLFGTPAAEGIPGPSGAYGAVPGSGDFSDLALGQFGYSEDIAPTAWPNNSNPTDYNEILAAAPIDVKPEPSSEGKNLRANLRSRRNTKLVIRTRKREHLSKANEKYRESKYDSYFTFGAMSEDEEVEVVGADGKKTKEYQVCAWDFASDEYVKIREAIDDTPDPVSSKKTERKRGPVRSGPPNKTQAIHTGLRTWMIKKDIMDNNLHWIDEGRVYRSGPEWSDLEPSVKTSKSVSKRLKTEAPPDLSLAQQTQGDWLQAKQEVENYWATRRTEGEGK